MPPDQREAEFKRFSELLGGQQENHLFNFLLASQIEAALKAAKKAKVSGLQGLSAEERQILLDGGALDWFAKQLGIAEDRPAKEPARRAAAPAWIAQARKLLEVAKKALRAGLKNEPIKPETMTSLEYSSALAAIRGASSNGIFLANAGQSDKAIVHKAIYNDDIIDMIETLMPRTVRALRREAYKGLLEEAAGSRQALENLVTGNPRLRFLLASKAQEQLNRRATWDVRVTMYAAFSKLTGDSRPWSLLHPFDDLDESEMKAAIATVRQGNERGLASLSDAQRTLLLTAGAIDWFERQLATAEQQTK